MRNEIITSMRNSKQDYKQNYVHNLMIKVFPQASGGGSLKVLVN